MTDLAERWPPSGGFQVYPPAMVAVYVNYIGPTNYKGSRVGLHLYRDDRPLHRYLSYDNRFSNVSEQANSYIFNKARCRPIGQAQVWLGGSVDTLLYAWEGGHEFINQFEIIRDVVFKKKDYDGVMETNRILWEARNARFDIP